MDNVYNYETFELFQLLERVDYEWDIKRGIEIDHRNKIEKSIKKSFNRSTDKKQWFNNFITKVQNLNHRVKVVLISILVPIMIASGAISNNDIINVVDSSDKDMVEVVEKIVKDQKTIDKELEIIKKNNPNLIRRDTADIKVSEFLVEMLKKEEKLSLVGYDIGDGKITIGYGHAEPKHNSKYKVGQKITEKQANSLFRKDLKKKVDGVKRIFQEWKEEGINIKITQYQFDSMVSMAYNMGISGLRQTEFIKLVKQNRMDMAAEKIKSTGLRDGFSGLKTRRQKESEIFAGIFNEY